MPVRCTPNDVKAVLAPGKDYDLRRNPPLDVFILTASLLVDEVETKAAGAYSASRLKTMETWLAAHAYKQSDKDFSARSTAGASGTFAGRTDMRLDSTLYGQMAQTLDTMGFLAVIESRPVQAGGDWLGIPPTSQTEYWDR
jgi:hypothetical protein